MYFILFLQLPVDFQFQLKQEDPIEIKISFARQLEN